MQTHSFCVSLFDLGKLRTDSRTQDYSTTPREASQFWDIAQSERAPFHSSCLCYSRLCPVQITLQAYRRSLHRRSYKHPNA